jgi:hypothetical protein
MSAVGGTQTGPGMPARLQDAQAIDMRAECPYS